MFERSIRLRWVAALLLVSLGSNASAEPKDNCRYRSAGVSVPAYQVSSKEVGHPWRALYGYCLVSSKRFVVHQDWVLSYLDADPIDTNPGGDGIGLGTDFFVRWHPDWRPSLVPYVDMGIGLQYAAVHPFPADGSRWMFTLHAGPGWLIPLRDDRQASLTLRYLHISNAGWTGENSGYDVVHVVLGMRWGKD
ncbi:MAG: acyloxyacyl hydrolase [Woeseiaceae bacterium]|nr:acyloxyacyl hydrolase [Woeseiaceae bacterium]